MKWLIITVLLIPAVLAQIDQDVLDRQGDVCGNGKRERFELCDDPKGRDHGLCTSAGKILKIVMVCHPQNCGCIPYKNKDCGNGVLEGSEFCENGIGDKCPELGQLIGEPLECNPSSCQCTVGSKVLLGAAGKKEEPVNKTAESTSSKIETQTKEAIEKQETSECGNRILEADEQCDPEGRICTYEDNGARLQGICTKECSCGPLPAEQVKEQNQEEVKKEIQEIPVEKSRASNKIMRIVIGILLLFSAGALVAFMMTRKKTTNPVDEMEKIENEEQK